MCKHRYYPMDILFLEDEKIELVNSTIGDVAIAILSKTWAKLAQMDKADYSYPTNWKMLKLSIKSTSSVKVIERVIRDFGLFAFEGEGDKERFFSPRLRDHLRSLDAKADAYYSTEDAVAVKDRRGRILSPEARERMAHGGRKYRPLEEGSTKVGTKVEEGSTKVDTKVEEGSTKVDTKVEEGSTKVGTKVEEGSGGTIGGLNAPNKEESLKSKDPKEGVVVAKRSARFCPPTLDEVKEYCRENGIAVDAEKFYHYYEGNGWMVGKNKMQKWKSSIRTWERKEDSYARPANQPPRQQQQNKLPINRDSNLDRSAPPLTPYEQALLDRLNATVQKE